ncbi:MAG: BlaI/MecI/CopY family transcriptional regulator [Verrucomicrobiales bacterium]
MKKPTDSELAILHALWDHGPATVAEVIGTVGGKKPMGYTTALKFLQIMHEKGLVKRDESRRQHVYRAALPPGRMRKALVGDLIDRAFGGSAAQMVLHALGARKVGEAEIAEIREMLDAMAKGGEE